jgi:hypothetical protein
MRVRPFLTSLFAAGLLAAGAFFAGCSTTSQEVYDKQISEADAAYRSGKITTAEYLKLKQDAQNAYLQRKNAN